MQTPTTNHFARFYSLQDTDNLTDDSASLLILPEPVVEKSMQQPTEQPLYTRLSKEDEDWRVSGVLHDFNNQLAIILSHCSIALTKLPLESNARGNLERAVRATKRAADLSSQLQIARTEQFDEQVTISLNELVREALDALEPQLSAKATLTLNLADSLPGITVTPSLIQRALVNLLLNAIDAIEAPTGEIRLSTEQIIINESTQEGYQQYLPRGLYVALQIIDNGDGMDQVTLDQIFEPYFSTKAVGTGLGLTIALHVVQLYRGMIYIRSTEGVGTLIRVLLPVKY